MSSNVQKTNDTARCLTHFQLLVTLCSGCALCNDLSTGSCASGFALWCFGVVHFPSSGL